MSAEPNTRPQHGVDASVTEAKVDQALGSSDHIHMALLAGLGRRQIEMLADLNGYTLTAWEASGRDWRNEPELLAEDLQKQRAYSSALSRQARTLEERGYLECWVKSRVMQDYFKNFVPIAGRKQRFYLLTELGQRASEAACAWLKDIASPEQKARWATRPELDAKTKLAMGLMTAVAQFNDTAEAA